MHGIKMRALGPSETILKQYLSNTCAINTSYFDVASCKGNCEASGINYMREVISVCGDS